MKERNAKQYVCAIHGHHITCNLINKLPHYAESECALLCDFVEGLPVVTTKLIRIRMIHHLKPQFPHYGSIYQVSLTIAIQNS